MTTKKFNINRGESVIEWTGKKVTGSHNGTISLASGTLTLTEGQLTGGNIIVDMTSIKILDIKDPNTNAQFAGHLVSEDFFATKEHPTATLEIKDVSKPVGSTFHIVGNLTIRGITNIIEFDAEINKINNNTLQATCRLIIDRTRYNMKFRSGNYFRD